jgi:hypothetical protein
LLHLVGHLYYSPTLMMHGQTQIKFGAEFVQLKCSCNIHKSQCTRPTPSEHLCTPLKSSFH